MIEQRLRELLEHDSADAPPGGVSLAAVDARVRGLRRRRGRLAGSAAAVALALAFATVVMIDWPEPARDHWTEAASQPGPERFQPELPLFHQYKEGGKRYTSTFTTAVTKVTFAARCPDAGYALIWLNGELVASGPCGPTIAAPPGRLDETAVTRDGVNELSTALVPASVAGTGRMTQDRADELLAGTAAYPAEWRLTIVDSNTPGCRADAGDIGSGTGEIRLRCDQPAPDTGRR
ncbi:hypothetical protein [Nonomuraea jiangxiensis]|uniref:Uncharacterized protein n=1 Tax=Nonomuraea jiangxiensis TaxID=633440 RepID=A0A1G9QUD5_9ACTN|nr:hypothetical protein [Nonomuraea jiangxiensis]SDM14563.1 hypothetical protein SAMN05421869_13711 [Nonomuraea jiangxiensis]